MRRRSSAFIGLGTVSIAVASVALSAAPAQAAGTTVCAYPKPIRKGNPCIAAGFPGALTYAGVDTALANVAAGDSIQVEPGTYSDPLTVSLSGLSIFGDTAKTERPIIAFAADSGHSTTLSTSSAATGLLLRHLDLRQTGASGFALTIGDFGSTATSTLEDLAISSAGDGARFDGMVTATGLTVAAGTGTGVSFTRGTTTLTHGTVSTASVGGGLSTAGSPALVAGGQFTIDDVTVSAPTSDRGVGMTAYPDGTGSVAKHLRVTGGGLGIGVHRGFSGSGASSFSLSDSQVVAPAEVTADGIMVAANARLAVASSTVVSGGIGLLAKAGGYNLADPNADGPAGGSVRLTNSIVRGASLDLTAPLPDPGAQCFDAGHQAATCQPGDMVVDHSDVRASVDGPRIVDGGGNISADPLFVSGAIGPGQDLHLQPGSPAIDSATAPFAGELDLDGVARAFGALPDMGAFESTYVAPTPTPAPLPLPSPTPVPLDQGGVKLPPSNAFSIVGKPTEGVKGAVSFVLALPGPGTVAIASTLPPVKPKTKRKTGVKPAPLVSFGTAAATPTSQGNATVTVTPSRKGSSAIKALKGSKKFTIAVAITYTPTGGAAKTITTTVKVGVPPKPKRKKK